MQVIGEGWNGKFPWVGGNFVLIYLDSGLSFFALFFI